MAKFLSTLLFVCLCFSTSYGQTEAFKRLINSIEKENTLIPSLVKDFVKITAIEELEDSNDLQLFYYY